MNIKNLFKRITTVKLEENQEMQIDVNNELIRIYGEHSLISVQGDSNTIIVIGDSNNVILLGHKNKINITGNNNKIDYLFVDNSFKLDNDKNFGNEINQLKGSNINNE